jgi:hypothetical protein
LDLTIDSSIISSSIETIDSDTEKVTDTEGVTDSAIDTPQTVVDDARLS